MPVEDYYQEYGPIHRRRASNGQKPDDTPPPQPRPRRPARRPPTRRASPLRLLLGFLLTILAVVLLFPYGLSYFYADQALPGVSIQGMSVAGQDQSSIRAALQARYADFSRQPLSLTYAGQTWEPTLAQMGVQFDLERAAVTALEAGRQGDPLTRLRDLWALWRAGLDVAPRLVIDQRHLQGYLVGLTADVERPPQDAALSLAAGQIIGAPAAVGRQALVDETANDVILALQTLAPQQVTLRTRVLEPTVGNTSLQAAENRARELLSSSLTLTHDERNWTWEPERLAEMVRVAPAGNRLLVEIDPNQLGRAVERLAQLVDSGSVEPRLRFADGDVQIVAEGQSGWRLLQPDAARLISATLSVGQPLTRTLALPVEELQPRITAANLADLGIRELVGEGKSSFVGSAQYRITNIKAGAVRMDGVLIAPDEEFSFNTQLGAVNAENGFVEGYAVIGNRTQLEWGGGVCQDSTTVFRAAFWAGLPITERHAHPFYISWYDRFGFGAYGDGAGLDAAIYTGVNDLRFVNDTGHWLLMHADVDEVNQVLTVRLYGTKPNRTVTMEGPFVSNQTPAPAAPVYVNDSSLPAGVVRQSDVARSGRDIVVYRIISENGVEVRRDTFFTRFKAWPNVFVRGTG